VPPLLKKLKKPIPDFFGFHTDNIPEFPTTKKSACPKKLKSDFRANVPLFYRIIERRLILPKIATNAANTADKNA
jgi:hypothetical protein